MSLINQLLAMPQSIIYIAIGLMGIGFIIGFHELGHFLFCKLFNVRTPSFSIGFGPKLIKKRIGDTEFSLSAIPLGGYVEIAGESEDDSGSSYSSFSHKPWYQKFLIILGGIGFNLIFSYFVFIMLFFTGLPKSPLLYPLNADPIVSTVSPGSAAAHADLRVGDRITALNNTPVGNDVEKLITILRLYPNEHVSLTIERNGQEQTLKPLLGSRDIAGTHVGTLGTAFEIVDTPGYSFIESIKHGVNLTNRYILNTAYAFKRLFVKRDTSRVGGPLSIIMETVKGAQQGPKIFFLFLAMISLSLAVLNVLPFPPLDGGRVFFFTVEAVIGRPLPDRAKEFIQIGCLFAFLALTLYLSGKDIMKFFGLGG